MEKVHLNLRPEHIAFKANGELIIMDFSQAHDIGAQYPLPLIPLGSTDYTAPELLRNDPTGSHYAMPADVFSIGIITFVLFHGYSLKGCKDVNNLYRLLENEELEEFWDRLKVVTGIEASEDLQNLITTMISPIPEIRIKIGEALKHPWLNNYSVATQEDLCRCLIKTRKLIEKVI